MKRLYVNAYHYREGLEESDLRELTRKFAELGSSEGVVAHYERLDGKGGFLVQEEQDDPEKDFELTIRYNPWVSFDVCPVTTIEEAFPVIQRVYG